MLLLLTRLSVGFEHNFYVEELVDLHLIALIFGEGEWVDEFVDDVDGERAGFHVCAEFVEDGEGGWPTFRFQFRE